ncbi:MAG: hypothetical protein ACO3QV_06820 [Candidatus Nanopelagicaceae bacterium]|jgi:hypothetical protein
MREQEIAYASLFIMTAFNAILGILMIAGLVPVVYGMVLAFFGMAVIVHKAWRMLMGDIRPWESPKQYHERINK